MLEPKLGTSSLFSVATGNNLPVKEQRGDFPWKSWKNDRWKSTSLKCKKAVCRPLITLLLRFPDEHTFFRHSNLFLQHFYLK